MLIIFFRTLILFTVLLAVMRLMGKRQIGEMEPFELVITLVISELACIPMSDRNIPITFGIVAILTMFIIHQLVVTLSKNSKMQNILSGKPVMVVDKKGINLYALKQMNMQVSDLLQSLRATGHFSLEEIDYGIMETNGQLSVVAKQNTSEQTLPVPVIMDGEWDEEDILRNNVPKKEIETFLKQRRVKVKDVALLTVDEHNKIVAQFTRGDLFSINYEGDKLVRE